MRAGWRFRDGVLLMALVALAAYVAWPIGAEVFETGWNDAEQSHVLLAPGIALWLAWVRRERLRNCRPTWTLLGPVVIGLGWFLAWYGFARSVDLYRHLGALAMVGGAALTVLGVAFLRRFFIPCLALLFLLPVPGRLRQEIAMPLQKATAFATQAVLELAGFDVVRQGNTLAINGQEVRVAEACNGMRMVAALALVSFAFVFSIPMRTWARVFILVLSPLIALVVNVIRLIPTVLVYGYGSEGVADAFHDISGWLVLFVALGLLWLVLEAMRWMEVPIDPFGGAGAVP